MRSRFFRLHKPTYTRAMLASDLFFECYGLPIVTREALDETYERLIATAEALRGLRLRPSYDKDFIIWHVSTKLRKARNEALLTVPGVFTQQARQIGRASRLAAARLAVSSNH